MDMMSVGGHSATGFSPAPVVDEPRDADTAWRDLPALALDATAARAHRIDIDGHAPDSGTWDELRTRTALTMMHNEWHVLGVTAPTSGCGSTTVAANLAFGLSRQNNCRVVLIDLNMGRPAMARLLGVNKAAPLGDYLGGGSDARDCFSRFGDALAIGFNTKAENCASEILLDARVQMALAELRRQLRPDYVILDLPPMIGGDEVLACLPLLNAALLVVGANRSTVGEIDMCESELSDRSNLLGVVLNMCRDGPARYGY